MSQSNSSVILRAACVSLLAVLALAQDGGEVVQIGSQDVLRVGAHIACSCGCKETVACAMALQGCSFCNKGRVRIAKMQQAGMGDQQIIDSFIKEYGADVYRAGPNSFFWAVPYGALALGLLAIYFFVRQSFRPKPAAELASAPKDGGVEIDPRYMEVAEKETSRLDQ